MTRPTKGLADAPSADARAPIPLLRSRLHSGWREWIYTRILELDASWTGSSIAAPTRPCRTGCRPRRGSPPSPTPSANGPHPCRCGSEPTGLVRGPCRRGRPGPAVGSSRARRTSARHPRRGRAGSGTSDSRVAAPRAATKPPSPDPGRHRIDRTGAHRGTRDDRRAAQRVRSFRNILLSSIPVKTGMASGHRDGVRMVPGGLR